MKFIQQDFQIETYLKSPFMAHLSTVKDDESRDSPVWFIWEGSFLWIFGTNQDLFIKEPG